MTPTGPDASNYSVTICKMLVWLLLASIVTYIVCSLSFIYIRDWGWGILLSLICLGLYFIQRYFFIKVHKKWNHINDVRKFMVLDVMVEESPHTE